MITPITNGSILDMTKAPKNPKPKRYLSDHRVDFAKVLDSKTEELRKKGEIKNGKC